uniref:Uncharacterized protein n=1 Tax=Opuntia streptacantha TaxID=393608 RepID=A0A7C9EDH6_OPUST
MTKTAVPAANAQCGSHQNRVLYRKPKHIHTSSLHIIEHNLETTSQVQTTDVHRVQQDIVKHMHAQLGSHIAAYTLGSACPAEHLEKAHTHTSREGGDCT